MRREAYSTQMSLYCTACESYPTQTVGLRINGATKLALCSSCAGLILAHVKEIKKESENGFKR